MYFLLTVAFQPIHPFPVSSLVDVDLIDHLSPVPGSNGWSFVKFWAADGQTSQ